MSMNDNRPGKPEPIADVRAFATVFQDVCCITLKCHSHAAAELCCEEINKALAAGKVMVFLDPPPEPAIMDINSDAAD